MGLKEPVPGLRRLHHDSNQTAKVSLSIGPGDELEVSENVAAQLQTADIHFVDADATTKADQARARAEEAARVDAEEAEAAARDDDTETETDEAAAGEAAKPRRRKAATGE